MIFSLRLSHTLEYGDALPILLSEYLVLVDKIISGSDVDAAAKELWGSQFAHQDPLNLLPPSLDDSQIKLTSSKVDLAFHEKIMSLCKVSV